MPFKSIQSLRDKSTCMKGLDCTRYWILCTWSLLYFHKIATPYGHFVDIHQQARIGIAHWKRVETAIIMTKIIARQSSRLWCYGSFVSHNDCTRKYIASATSKLLQLKKRVIPFLTPTEITEFATKLFAMLEFPMFNFAESWILLTYSKMR